MYFIYIFIYIPPFSALTNQLPYTSYNVTEGRALHRCPTLGGCSCCPSQ